AVLRFTLSNATGTSEPGTITLTIIGRPDPSQDPEVIGLLSAQADAARRFARVQTRNFNDRLEQLHDEGDRRRNSMNVRLGIVQSDRTSRAEREIQRMIEDGHGANAENVVQGLLAYGPEGATGARSSSGDENGAPATTFASPDLGSFAVWTGGFVNFGERENGGLDIDHTMVGLSGGVDYRFSDKFVAGFGAGYGRDRSDIGGNGTESRASAYSAAIYGSYKPFRNVFIDGLIGGSWLDFDSNRYITSTGDFASGTRSGHQFFGSVTAAYDYRDDTWLISPYGRIEFSRSWLDGFTEKGSDSMALRYGDQTVDSVSGVLGLRAEYTFMLDWGTLTPGARFEYTHDFIGSSRAHLGYADLGGLPYVVEIESAEQNYATLGLSLDATLPQDWSLGFDYRTSLGRDQQDHAIGLRVGKKF
ncbi:autotransporter outer membrane beta-barrel domain-containing protein, partial [Aquamicrobium sp. LC103]|uniref:autotransporter outer membrane beta-barrel domain-containing protein n=1 Tax=Aquamicrobium sp. LC103 TaxID=1120658 RepID=UPI0010CA0FB5